MNYNLYANAGHIAAHLPIAELARTGQATEVLRLVDDLAAAEAFSHKDSISFLQDNFPQASIQGDDLAAMEQAYRDALHEIRESIAVAEGDSARAKAARKVFDGMCAALTPFWAAARPARAQSR